MIDQAVILVGGLGTRLGPLTAKTPKPLLEVAGKPFLHYLLDELARQGISNILLLAGFRGEQIERLQATGPKIRVVVEPEPLGTGGALRFASTHLSERFFLLNGDSLFDINLWDLARFAGDTNALSLRAVEDVSRFGPAILSGDEIIEFFERGGRPGPGLINGGVSVLLRNVLDLIPIGQSASLEGQVYPVLASKHALRGRVYDRPFLDIGVPEDFVRAQTWVPAVLDRGEVVFRFDEIARMDNDILVWSHDAIARIKAANDVGYTTLLDTTRDSSSPAWGQRLLEAMNADLMAWGARLSGLLA